MINTIFSIDIYEKALYRKIFIVKFVLNIRPLAKVVIASSSDLPVQRLS